MKYSEELKKELEELKAEHEATIQDCREYATRTNDFSLVYRKDDLLRQDDRIRELKKLIVIEERRELDVGDGCTLHLWSDSHACTVIKRTAKTITIQEDKATLDPNFKPEWIDGGFAGHCTNQNEQSYTYERDPNGTIHVCRWSEKHGCFQTGDDGSIKITVGRHEFYDYNF